MRHQPHCMLVTGAAGFIGSNFVRHILEHDHQIRVIGLDSLTYSGVQQSLDDCVSSYGDRFRFIHSDIRDADAMKELVKEEAAILSFISQRNHTWIVLLMGHYNLSIPM